MKTVKDLKKLLHEQGLLVYQINAESDRKESRAKEEGAHGKAGKRGAKEKAQRDGGYSMDNMDREISWITYDSREVKPGTVFICKGAAFDVKYLRDAAAAGCIAYVADRRTAERIFAEPEDGKTAGMAEAGASGEKQSGIPGFIVSEIRKAMAVIAADFFEYEPGTPLLTGITGTKGKTTTAWYLKGMLDAWEREKGGQETGLLSTVQNYDGKIREDSAMTTPEALVLHEHLANAKQNGLSHVTMEVSSQALKYRRVQGLRFTVGIFLNISEDHISPAEHGDFEDYFSSKLSIFRQTETACVNLDSDESGRILKAARKAGRVVTFGRSPSADVRCSRIRRENGKLVFRAECDQFSEDFCLAMRGAFNIENAMAAITAAYVYGVPVHCMKEALARTQVPGRMETFCSLDGRICGIVDFAHNRLSFERLFDAIYQEYSQYSRIVSVFGCPGGKGLNRRRDLGLIAGLFSDKVYLTTDDPMDESAQTICEEVRDYVELVGCDCECIEDREQAICTAVAGCGNEKTLILVLGRGSEKYQRIGGKAYRYPTDAEILGQALREYDGWGEMARRSRLKEEKAGAYLR